MLKKRHRVRFQRLLVTFKVCFFPENLGFAETKLQLIGDDQKSRDVISMPFEISKKNQIKNKLLTKT